MVKKNKSAEEVEINRPARTKVSKDEALKRMADFSKRKEKFIASTREGVKRGA
jgi:hypothetical protein